MDTLFLPFTLISLVVLIFSVILHEVAHGYVADRLGDPTARLLGRLTLNPIPHIDLFMTIIFPLMLILSGSPVLFGGAKPVPVDTFNLKDGRKDLAMVSLSGPMTNILLAVVGAILYHAFFPNTPLGYLPAMEYLPQFVLVQIITLNVMLGIFNLLPIPPLDGSKLFSLLLPEKLAHDYLSIGNLGTFILFFLLFVPIGPFSLQETLYSMYSYGLTLLGF